MISHPHNWILVTGAKLGLNLCLCVPKFEGGGGGGVEGKGQRQKVIEEDPVCRALTQREQEADIAARKKRDFFVGTRP